VREASIGMAMVVWQLIVMLERELSRAMQPWRYSLHNMEGSGGGHMHDSTYNAKSTKE
jgi:hypothetical protein